MIIFDLDGTLANCEHRRHFVKKPERCDSPYRCCICKKCEQFNEWQPNWPAFYEACDLDTPIKETLELLETLTTHDEYEQLPLCEVQIWSGRCESVRKKTEEWLDKNLLCFESHQLKMRPIGDNTPDDVLKERWLDEYLASMWPKLPQPNEAEGKVFYRKDAIDFVFDSHPKSIAMWRRRGIFVFNCAQSDGEF
jgi:hypothetical protein